MIIVAALPASQRRLSSPPAARWNIRALSSTARQRARPTLAASSAKELVVFIPAANYPRRQPPKRRQRFVHDPKIPIGRARPNSALPPRGFLLGRLSNAGPTSCTTIPEGAGVRNPSPLPNCRRLASV